MPLAQNKSYLATITAQNNFCSQLSAALAVTDTSNSVTFTNVEAVGRTTFEIANITDVDAYIGWGVGSATATVATSTPAPNCKCIPANSIFTHDFTSTTGGTVDTIAAITASGSATLQITLGSGT